MSQLVLPARYRPMVFRAMHDDNGHLGMEWTTELIKDRFYWPRMTSEIAMYVQNCGRCVARKSLPKRAAPLQQITSTGPLDLVCIDFLSIEPDSKGIANVMVITDHYTRYAQAQTSTPLTRALKAKMDNESQTQPSEHLNQECLTSESDEEGGYYLPQLTLDTRPETQSQEFEPRDVIVLQDTAVSADSSIHDLPEEDKVVQLPDTTEQ